MDERKNLDDFLKEFNDFSKEEKSEILKKLMPQFCQIAMENKNFFSEMMPSCMEMMKRGNFSMKDMISRMMGNS